MLQDTAFRKLGWLQILASVFLCGHAAQFTFMYRIAGHRHPLDADFAWLIFKETGFYTGSCIDLPRQAV